MPNITLARTWTKFTSPTTTTPPSSPRPAAENAEDAEFPPIDWDAVSANSADSAGVYVQAPVLPMRSILEDWYTYARRYTEGAHCYLSGAILPVMGALLGRRVWMSLGGNPKYPNIFALICGKPGDRKSTTIRLAAVLARKCLPAEAFLPASFSPESLFDEYDLDSGGQPDKLWLVDEANSVLTDWQRSCNGERNATRFLELYDCAPLSESFRRNLNEDGGGEARRFVDSTSTSVVFGATFNVACFQGQAVRTGMARRFLYYAAERRGCDLLTTPPPHAADFEALVAGFSRCREIAGEMTFAPDAASQWLEYQKQNRATTDATSLHDEALLSRLASAPAQTLAVAMIFEAAMWAKRGGPWPGVLSLEALTYAIEHVNECLGAARLLDGIAERRSIEEDAEVIYSRIRHDFMARRRGLTIYLTRSELTRAYCHDSGRRHALKPRHLYEQLIPALARKGKAMLALKQGCREVYAFRAEEG